MNSLMTKIFMLFSGISFSLTCSENLSELDCDYLYAGNVPNFIPSETGDNSFESVYNVVIVNRND